MISRPLKEKGINEYLDVADSFRADTNIKFILFSDLDTKSIDKQIIEKINAAKKNNSIQLMSYSDNIHEDIKSANCLVHPSYREGISTVLVEAASLATPIITTDVPGCIDVVPDDSHGILCSPRSASSLSNAIKKFLSYNQEEITNITDNAYNHAYKNYNRKNILKLYEELDKYVT